MCTIAPNETGLLLLSVEGKSCCRTGQFSMPDDRTGRMCSCKSPLPDKQVAISLGADSVIYISDTTKRFLKSVTENFEANHAEASKVRIPHVFEESVKGYFHTCGKKCRGAIDTDANSACSRNSGVSDLHCLLFTC